MKEKLSRDQEGKENAIQSNSRGVSEGASLEDTIAKVTKPWVYTAYSLIGLHFGFLNKCRHRY